MKRRGSATPRMTLEEFKRRWPKEAQKIEAEDLARKAGKVPAMGQGQGRIRSIPTDVEWLDGIIVHLPSKTEANVARRLISEVRALRILDAAAKRTLTRLFRQVKISLLTIDPRDRGIPLVLTVDFAIVYSDGRRRYIDAKPKKWKSRDWLRGKLAAQADLGITIEEVNK